MEALHQRPALRAPKAPRVKQHALPRHTRLTLRDHLPAAPTRALPREPALSDRGHGDLGLGGQEGAVLLEVALRREGLAVGHEHEPYLRREEPSEEGPVLLRLALHERVRVKVQRLHRPPLLRLGLHKEPLVPRQQGLDRAQERPRDGRVRVAPARRRSWCGCVALLCGGLEDRAEGVAEGPLDVGGQRPGAGGPHEDGACVCLEHVDLLEGHAHVADGDEGAVEAPDEEGHRRRDVADQRLWEDRDEHVLPREGVDQGAERLHRLGQHLRVAGAHEDALLAEERREQLDDGVDAQGAEHRREGDVVREGLGLGTRQRVLAALERLDDDAVAGLREGQGEDALEDGEDGGVREGALLLDDVEDLGEEGHAGDEAHDADALGAGFVEVAPAVAVLLGAVGAREDEGEGLPGSLAVGLGGGRFGNLTLGEAELADCLDFFAEVLPWRELIAGVLL